MSRCTTVLLVASLMLAAGCSRPPNRFHQASAIPSAAGQQTPTDYVVGEPIQYANLSIFPVTSREPRSEDRFTTLNEGLRDGTVEVFEIGSDEPAEEPSEARAGLPSDSLGDLFGDPQPSDCDDTNETESDTPAPDDPFSNEQASDVLEETLAEHVNRRHIEGVDLIGAEVERVMVINRSRKPLYLMPGEIIMGGDQDRCVAKEFVIAPGDKPVPVDVFCVEHGRWGGRAREETQLFVLNALAVAEESVSFDANVDINNIADVANSGKFVASIGALNAKARYAVQASKDQSVVWDSVEAVNDNNGIAVESGAFTGNYTDEASLERLEPYHEALLEEVPKVENVVGVIVAINGEAQTMDLFESTPLFRKLWPKLLKSYALDAANSVPPEGESVSCARDEAIAFLEESMSGEVEDSEVLRGIATTRRATDEIVSFAARAATDADDEHAMSGMGGGGFGGGVHTSAFSK